jgi:bifunctional DNA-binding transcriptional regulator/antitoxin component of YhaV-PrlF toxin-antitoxin module
MSDVVQDLMAAFQLNRVQDVAKLFDVRPNTVSMWRTRGLPHRYRLKALRLATERRVALPGSITGDVEGSGSERTMPPATRPEGGCGRTACHLTIGPNGRVELPAPLLEAAGFHVGDAVIAEVDAREVRLRSVDQAIAEVQAMVRGFVPDDVSLVDELIAERRREAERE